LSEFAQENHDQYAEESLNAYKYAYKHALATLESVHPTRLGLALNFAVFYHGKSLTATNLGDLELISDL